GIASGARSWAALGRLGEGAMPAAIARDLAVINEGVPLLTRVASGEEAAISTERFSSIRSSVTRLEDFVRAGGRLTPDQSRLLSTYRARMVSQPASDLATVERALASAESGTPLAADRLAELETARLRLTEVARVRALSAAESGALDRLNTAIRDGSIT